MVVISARVGNAPARLPIKTPQTEKYLRHRRYSMLNGTVNNEYR